MNTQRRILLTTFVASTLLASQAMCVEVRFDIDPDRSFMVSTALIKAVGAPTVAQDDGADTTTYSGTITLELDDLETPVDFRFLSAEAIAAASGDWLPAAEGGSDGDPGDPAAANYGIVLDAGPVGVLFGAFRDTAFTIESDELFVENGLFDSGQTFTTTQGYLDSNIISAALGNDFGRDDVTGDNTINVSMEQGSYVFGADGVATITIPIDLDFLSGNADGVDFFFDGVMVATYGTPTIRIPGDANGDGRVDAADLNILGLNWQGMDKVWSDGDFTGDGKVDAGDLNVVGINWQTGVQAAAVPEPTGLSILLTAAFAIVAIQRRR